MWLFPSSYPPDIEINNIATPAAITPIITAPLPRPLQIQRQQPPQDRCPLMIPGSILDSSSPVPIATHLKLRREGRVESIAVCIVLGVDLEGHRGVRKVVKTKASFPAPESARKLLYLANQDITKKWIMPMQNWANILNQLAIRFAGRFPL